MHLLECVFILEYCNVCLAHPVEGYYFYKYREHARGRLVLETEVVKKVGLWL